MKNMINIKNINIMIYCWEDQDNAENRKQNIKGRLNVPVSSFAGAQMLWISLGSSRERNTTCQWSEPTEPKSHRKLASLTTKQEVTVLQAVQ